MNSPSGNLNGPQQRAGCTMGDSDTLNLHYGPADTSIALADGSVTEMLRWLKENGAAGDIWDED
jgi:hypothetical protein